MFSLLNMSENKIKSTLIERHNERGSFFVIIIIISPFNIKYTQFIELVKATKKLWLNEKNEKVHKYDENCFRKFVRKL